MLITNSDDKETEMTAIETFTPMILNQMVITVLCFLALGIVVQVNNQLKRIRRRWGYLKVAPRYAFAYLSRRLQSI